MLITVDPHCNMPSHGNRFWTHILNAGPFCSMKTLTKRAKIHGEETSAQDAKHPKSSNSINSISTSATFLQSPFSLCRLQHVATRVSYLQGTHDLQHLPVSIIVINHPIHPHSFSQTYKILTCFTSSKSSQSSPIITPG